MTTGKAAKSKSQKRAGWCTIFFHPGRFDDEGRPLRVRRGLGTQDDVEADAIVADLNALLAEPEWHTPAAKERASQRFHERAVSIFFDAMEPDHHDAWAQREAAIPLPTREEGYCRVMVVGSTGAGKTTFVRQVLGTDPERERFPSTSTAKTTVADLEAILGQGPFRAVLSFFPRDRVRGLIEECVVAAVGAAAEGADDSRVAGRLLEHAEQRFRLSYILGMPATSPEDDGGWDDLPNTDTEDHLVSPEDRRALDVALDGYLARCRVIGERMRDALAQQLSVDRSRASGSERDAFQELLEEEAQKRTNEFYAEIQALADDILDDVESRFSNLAGGTWDRARSGWPNSWTFESDDRAEFLRQVNRFTSNYAAHFGRLLTPLVQGIRVVGPFVPGWSGGEQPRLVLLDGEGLGHSSDSATSLPTSVTRRFQDVDVIALVDSATQPMLAGPAAVVRAAAAMGHDRKLAVLFTRFDEVKGANLPTVKAKQEHVRRSLDNAAAGLADVLGGTTVRGLLRNLEGRVFFLAAIDRRLETLDKPAMRRFTEDQLRTFIEVCEDAIKPPVPTEAHPVYDLGNLVLCLASATARFQRSWAGRLGVEVRPGVNTEHWTRIKALSRRLAEWDVDQYDNMRPVADLLRELTEGLANFLANPREWAPADAPDELKQAALEAVKREVSAALYEFTAGRLRYEPLVDWRVAYRLAGPGSGRQRARNIWDIYRDAAPRVTDVPTDEGTRFLDDVRKLFQDAVARAGGTVR